MLFWGALAVLAAAFVWYMIAVPGRSHSGPLPELDAGQLAVRNNLRLHVVAAASRERNLLARPAELEAAAQYIEEMLARFGYTPASQHFTVAGKPVRNIEVEVTGDALRSEIVIVGAHYDSAPGATGANDNGSGIAAALELARLWHGIRPGRTVRFVFFVNEEPPFFKSRDMGSLHYARRCRERNENVVGMLSLETIGYYSDAAGSQRYPLPLGLFYPSTGNFIAFVANLGSRKLLHELLGGFRRNARFPSEGVAAPALLPGVDWSDQWPFWSQGYPALMITDTALFRYPHYHQPSDTPERVNFDRLARVVFGLDGALREFAR